jgi:hypothetical protein
MRSIGICRAALAEVAGDLVAEAGLVADSAGD